MNSQLLQAARLSAPTDRLKRLQNLFERTIVSQTSQRYIDVYDRKGIAMVIPTYKPSDTTLQLIQDVRAYNPSIHIIVIDDCIPRDSNEYSLILQIKDMAKYDPYLSCIRTPVNAHKTGALNLGLEHAMKLQFKPDVIFTCDDDIVINENTLRTMVNALYSNKKIGAVCSRCLVQNKHVNLLTRLQALEYFSFTVTKIADNDFLYGPLVMQGMLTGFQTEVLEKINGFTSGHLIEDYDITVRVKKAGYNVAIAKDAQAWTIVPESFTDFWKQRVRWGYGGLQVIKDHIGFFQAIFQDLLGHYVFITLLLLIISSLVFYQTQASSNSLIQLIVFFSLVQFLLSYVFSLLTLYHYEDRDFGDWLLQASIIPGLLYSNLVTFVLLGCYFFLGFNLIFGTLAKHFFAFERMHLAGSKGFARIGYVAHWGTRAVQKELV